MNDDNDWDVKLVTKLLKNISGGTKRYGPKALAEKLLDSEDVILVKRP